MLASRIIPCLLLQDQGLVKTVKFKNPKYVGSPTNAIKIFNEKEVDELIFLDITATRKKRHPPFKLISETATECFMPFCYGGGINRLEDMQAIFSLGAEKVAINTQAILKPSLVKQASKQFGSQSIVVSIDVKKDLFGNYKVFSHLRKKVLKIEPVEFALQMEDMGAGELLVNSVDKDGTMEGYDIELIKKLTVAVNIPVIACGGAGSIEHFRDAINKGGASAVAAGSMFVFYGKHRAVLINYPSQHEVGSLELALSI